MKLVKPPVYFYIFGLIGFTAIITQILCIREFLVVFYGNEISLGIIFANWLFWTAVGSYLFGKITKRTKNPQWLMAILQILIAVVTPLTIIFIRFSKSFFQTIPGEILGFLPANIDSFLILSLFCLLSGGLFAVGSNFYSKTEKRNLASSSGYVYLMEAMGSAIGGLLVSLLFIPKFGSIQISVFLSFCNILTATYLILKVTHLKKFVIILGSTAAIVILLFAAPQFNSISNHFLWKGFHVLESRDSIYG